ncbi:MAG: hypothetical protein NVS4B7_14110 [Ktedonobacteraceae bacterium]
MLIVPPKPINIFCSSSSVPRDRVLHHELEKQLDSLERLGRITQWHDYDVQAGTARAEEVYAHLKVADIILLLISPDFMYSDYHYRVLMKQALERHNAGEALIIPIILRVTFLEGTPINALQKIPLGGKPIDKWRRRGDAIHEVLKYIFYKVNVLFSERWLNESSIYYDSKLYNEALKACEQAIELNPYNISAYMSKGAILWHRGYYQESLKVYEQIIRLDPGNIVGYMSRAYVLLNLSRFEEALKACEQAIYLDPNNAIAYVIKGYLLEILANQSFNIAKEIGAEAGQSYLDNKYFIIKMEKKNFEE